MVMKSLNHRVIYALTYISTFGYKIITSLSK